ncbi:MAG: phage virion morphogenesis protein [Magnetococcales bacterium]|nr:phage virion morphogenesis protein [Magnetococcales bacterium]
MPIETKNDGPIRIAIDDRAVLQLLSRLLERGADLRPAMRGIAGVLAHDTEMAFDREASPAGVPWRPLAESTKKARVEKKYPERPILQVTRLLVRSVHTDYGVDYAMIGSSAVYAAIHQLGGKAGRKQQVTIPARPYLGLSPAGQEEILATLSRYLTAQR